MAACIDSLVYALIAMLLAYRYSLAALWYSLSVMYSAASLLAAVMYVSTIPHVPL